jgi:ADP-heptose:LPS heptosyltransferase
VTHVLIARMDNDGDVLLAGPAVRAVASGADRVTLLCGPRGEQAARLLPGVDEVLVHHCPWIDAHPEPVTREATEAIVSDVAARRVDEAFVLSSFHQSPLPLALLLRLAGVPTIAATSVDYPGSLLDVRHRMSGVVHEVERSLALVATLGYTTGDRRLSVVRAPWDGVPAQPYVVVHPGASVSARAWAPERHAELVTALAAAGRQVVVTGAPSEVALTARVAGTDGVDLGGRTTLAQLAEVLAHADVVVVGNTGPAHLAAAVGTPVVSLFAPTVPVVAWHPWGVPYRVLHIDVSCAGCRARECPVPGHPCLEGITPDDVVAAMDRLARRIVPPKVLA